jgi:heat shock protein HslJ
MQKVFIFLSIVLISFSCAVNKKHANVTEKKYWVNSFKIDCEGVGLMSCLQVQENDKINPDAWFNFYSNIEGFDYRPGFVYKIKVRETELDESQVPADASSVMYELIEVLEKQVDDRLRIVDIWVLEVIEGKVLEQSQTDVRATFQIDVVNNRVYGNGSCNNFNGSLMNLTGNEIKISRLASTRMFCRNNTIENRYLKLLENAKTYEIGLNQLRMFDADNKNVLTFKKVD